MPFPVFMLGFADTMATLCRCLRRKFQLPHALISCDSRQSESALFFECHTRYVAPTAPLIKPITTLTISIQTSI
jgi:hypothetical protein